MANKKQPNFNYVKGYGENFKKLREKFGYTQGDLAKRFNVLNVTISNIEREKTTPTIEQLQLYHSEFNASYEYLLGETSVYDVSIQDVCEYTGLSESAINSIIGINEFDPASMDNINRILESPKLGMLLDSMAQCNSANIKREYLESIRGALESVINSQWSNDIKNYFFILLYIKIFSGKELYGKQLNHFIAHIKLLEPKPYSDYKDYFYETNADFLFDNFKEDIKNMHDIAYFKASEEFKKILDEAINISKKQQYDKWSKKSSDFLLNYLNNLRFYINSEGEVTPKEDIPFENPEQVKEFADFVQKELTRSISEYTMSSDD